MKILSIQLRVRYGIPVIIMGETGCGINFININLSFVGKTALVRYMCSLLRVPLFVLNVHGGIETKDILDFMSSGPIPKALSLSQDSSVFVSFISE